MPRGSLLETISRHRWLIVATFLTFVVVTALVSRSLPKVYSTDAKLLVALPADTQTFDTVQASQSFARSYAEIIDSVAIARRIADRLGDGTSATELLEATSFTPRADTQLLEITAENGDPERAQLFANAYADEFAEYASTTLARSTQAQVVVADRAPLPEIAARPKPMVYTLVAGLFGLALGIGLAMLRGQLDSRLRTVDDVEQRFDLPVLGRVPARTRSEGSEHAVAEAFRILRTNLQFVGGARNVRSIAVTSARDGEGKTMVVAELATALSEMGLTVVALEADLRRPALQQALLANGVEPLGPGLSNYLVETAEVDEILHPTDVPGLMLVPAGPLPPGPSTLLEVSRASELIAELLHRADLILVDTPPVSVGADASVLARWADGVILIADLQRSTEHGLRRAIAQIEAVQATPLGLVLNRDRDAAGSGYGYGYYGPNPGQAASRNGNRTLRRLPAHPARRRRQAGVR